MRIAAECLDSHDGRSLEGTNLALEVIAYGNAKPIAIVIIGRELSVFEASVVGLTIIDIALAQRTIGIAEPREVGGNDLGRAILHFYLEQGTECIGFAPIDAMHNSAVPPAGRYFGANGILALAQQSRYVMSGIEHRLDHFRCTGLELIIKGIAVLVGLAYTFAIDEDVIDAQSCCIEAGTTNAISQFKSLAEDGHTSGDAAILLHEALAAANGCFHIALTAATKVADIGSIEGITRSLEILAEGHGSVALFIINDLRDIVEICLLALVSGSADTYAKVANSQHALGVLIGIDQHIIYICTHVRRLAFQDDMVLLAN